MKSNFFAIQNQSLQTDAALLLLRIVSGCAFAIHGWGKIQDPFHWMGSESSIPGVLQGLAALSEFGGGLAWAVGLLTRLAALGDLHFGKSSAGSWQPLLAQIAQAADLLLLAGDLTDYGYPDEAHLLAKELNTALKIPIVAVLGNHDYEAGRQQEVQEILEAVGIHQVDVLAAVTGADEDNLVATSLARFEFNVPRTIARINNPKNAWMFTSEMGVDVALNQADLMGHLIAEEMSLGDMVTLLKLRKGQFSLIEEKVDPESIAAGKAIRELDLPAQCVFAAVIRKGELIIPRGDTVLQPADEVLAVVHASHLDDLAALLGRQATLADIN